MGQSMKKIVLSILVLQFSYVDVLWAQGEDLDAPKKVANMTALSAVKVNPLWRQQFDVEAAKVSCVAKAKFAMGLCFSSTNPTIMHATAVIGGMTAVVGGAMSLTDSCSKIGEAMKYANVALTAYNTACAGAMLVCKSSCANLLTTANAAETAGTWTTNFISGEGPSPHPIDVLDPATTVMADCAGYKWNMIAAGAGILAMVAQFGIAKKCEKETMNCKGNSVDPRCPAMTVDCSKTVNLTKVQCVCQIRPNTPGCMGATGGNRQDTYSRMTPEGNGTTINSNLNGGGANLGPDTKGFKGTEDPTTSVKGAGGAGGGGAAGGSGFSGAGAGGKKGETAKSLNANVLGGGDGGGGGGGGSGGHGGGYDDLDPKSPYKAFIPGGANDPSRSGMSKEVYSSQITGGGGKSNWEKVRDRYRDHKSSLLSN